MNTITYFQSLASEGIQADTGLSVNVDKYQVWTACSLGQNSSNTE